MNKWLISDTHFHHVNIIKYSNRPFNDASTDMVEGLIERWNNVVAPEDEVYFLGDFAMGRHTYERDRALADSLAGKKHMILGNHDRHIRSTNSNGEPIKIMDVDSAINYWKSIGFATVSRNPIVIEDYFILSHEPINGINKNQIFVNIHGHTHDISIENGNYFNVCVEKINYTPINFEEIKEYFTNA